MRLIEAYALPDAPEREAQMARIKAWRAPQWRDYFDIIMQLLDDVTASTPA